MCHSRPVNEYELLKPNWDVHFSAWAPHPSVIYYAYPGVFKQIDLFSQPGSALPSQLIFGAC